MTLPGESINTQTQSGDSVFENVWVFGKLNYTFENDDLGIRSIDVREPSIFQKTVTATSFIGPATQLTVEDENVDTECFPIFSKNATGNVEPKSGTTLRFNSSNGTLRAEKFSGDGSLLTNIQPGQVTGNSVFVSGMIILWSGAEVDIPTGFTLCNGQNNTPDLRDRFVVGAGNNYNVDATGGSADATLVSHQHSAGSYSAVSNGGHTHTYNFRSGTERADNDEDHQRNSGSSQYNTGSSGAHTHSISGSSSTEGSSATNANLPPYYALCYIMKT